MKLIPYLGPVTITDTRGTVQLDGLQKPRTLSQVEFLLDLVAEPGYAGDRKGLAAARFGLQAIEELKAQEGDAPTVGHWLVEDDRAACLKNALSGVRWNPQFQHCLVPFGEAVEAMRTVPSSEASKKQKPSK